MNTPPSPPSPTPQGADDLDRLRTEYARRSHRLAGSDRYSPFNKAHLFTIQSRQRAALSLLRQVDCYPLAGQRILELGCGDGGVLLEYLGFGAAPNNLHGLDLLPDRVRCAHARLPHLPLSIADGRHLPYPDSAFDLLLQYTVFTSILDDTVREDLARELLRLLRRPAGVILWYDYWLNPTNPHARGIRPPEIRRLFPGCEFHFRRLTLAPPLSRHLAPISWILAHLLEKLRIFNTHYLVAIRRLC